MRTNHQKCKKKKKQKRPHETHTRRHTETILNQDRLHFFELLRCQTDSENREEFKEMKPNNQDDHTQIKGQKQ